MIKTQQEENDDFVIATRDEQYTYAMVYFPTGKPIEVQMEGFQEKEMISWWYDPRTGVSFKGPKVPQATLATFTPPSSGKGNDWVLVLDEAKQHFPQPGQRRL